MYLTSPGRKNPTIQMTLFRRNTDYSATLFYPLLFSPHFIRKSMRETERLNSFKDIFRCLVSEEDWDAKQMEAFTHSLDLEV